MSKREIIFDTYIIYIYTSVQSKTNTHTDTRIENSHDDIYIYISYIIISYHMFISYDIINEYL